MKKYITVAALLAAGAAFANAADVDFVTFSGTADTPTTTLAAGTTYGSLTLKEDMTTGKDAWQLQAPDATDPVLDVNITGGGFYAGNYTLSLWVDENTFNTSGETILFAYSGSTESNAAGYNALVWDATNSCLKMGRGNFTASNMAMAWYDDPSYTDVSSSQTTTLLDGWNNITIAVTGANQSQTVTYWINGAELGTGDNYNGNMNNGTDKKKMGYYINNNVSYGTIALTNEKLTTASAIATLATIPEPSAFGLLAGIGALALVASRRRRK